MKKIKEFIKKHKTEFVVGITGIALGVSYSMGMWNERECLTPKKIYFTNYKDTCDPVVVLKCKNRIGTFKLDRNELDNLIKDVTLMKDIAINGTE